MLNIIRTKTKRKINDSYKNYSKLLKIIKDEDLESLSKFIEENNILYERRLYWALVISAECSINCYKYLCNKGYLKLVDWEAPCRDIAIKNKNLELLNFIDSYKE